MNTTNDFFSDDYFNNCVENKYEELKCEIKNRLQKAGDKETTLDLYKTTFKQGDYLTHENLNFTDSIKCLFEFSYALGWSIKELLEAAEEIKLDHLHQIELEKNSTTEILKVRKFPFDKYNLIKKTKDKDGNSIILNHEEYTLFDLLIKKFIVFLKNIKCTYLKSIHYSDGIKLSIEPDDNISFEKADTNNLFTWYVEYVAKMKISDFLNSYDIKNVQSEATNSDQEQPTISESKLNDEKYASIKYPISKRTDKDGLTSLNSNQTAIAFYYLRSAKVIVDKAYLKDTDLSKVINICTGYSHNTSRTFLSKFQNNPPSNNHSDIKEVKKIFESILNEINKDIKSQ